MMYYYPGTLSSGSADPLRPFIDMRSLLGTGWGPRGDSGSARGRVRATQPALFKSLILQSLRTWQNRKVPIDASGQEKYRFNLVHRIGTRLSMKQSPERNDASTRLANS